MKQIEKEVKTTEIFYEAADGQQFIDRDACLKYDQSLMCALRANIREFAINEGDEYSVKGVGSCDNYSYVVIPRNDTDIMRIQQLYAAINNNSVRNGLTSEDVGKVIIVTIGYDQDWVDVDKLDSIIDSMTAGKYKAVPVKK